MLRTLYWSRTNYPLTWIASRFIYKCQLIDIHVKHRVRILIRRLGSILLLLPTAVIESFSNGNTVKSKTFQPVLFHTYLTSSSLMQSRHVITSEDCSVHKNLLDNRTNTTERAMKTGITTKNTRTNTYSHTHSSLT